MTKWYRNNTVPKAEEAETAEEKEVQADLAEEIDADKVSESSSKRCKTKKNHVNVRGPRSTAEAMTDKVNFDKEGNHEDPLEDRNSYIACSDFGYTMWPRLSAFQTRHRLTTRLAPMTWVEARCGANH